MGHPLRRLLANYRRLLFNYDSILAYSVLGIAGGVASGLIVLAFEFAIAELSLVFGVGGGGDGFEGLTGHHAGDGTAAPHGGRVGVEFEHFGEERFGIGAGVGVERGVGALVEDHGA